MGQIKHVTSASIRGLADDLDKSVHDQIDVAKHSLDKCEVPFPSFGLLGLPLMWSYDQVLGDFRTYFDTLKTKMAGVSTTLRTKTAPAWQDAEDHNTVLYGDR